MADSKSPPNAPASKQQDDVSVVPRHGAPWSHYLWFFALAAAGCAADLLSKHYIFRWRGMPLENSEWWLIKGYVGIQTALNPGALFGGFAGLGSWLAVLSIAAAIGVLVWLFAFGAARDFLLTTALGLISGGILGNLYDRLGWWHEPHNPAAWHHEVRDWILFRYGDYTWPNFNIADSLLVCGAALLVYHALFLGDKTAQRQETAQSPKSTSPERDSQTAKPN